MATAADPPAVPDMALAPQPHRPRDEADGPVLRVFGLPALRAGGRWHPWPREQRFRLLGFLAVEARAVDRDELACLFWPDEPAEAARRNLRKTLYRLRPWLADAGLAPAGGPTDAVDDAGEAVGLRDGRRLRWHGDSDLQRLRRALAGSDAVAAADLCNAPLLQGLDGGSNPFQAWLDQARAHCQRQWRDLALQAIAQQPSVVPVLDWTERLLAQDPLDEPVMRARVRALVGNGQVAAARDCHVRWRRLARDELGLDTPDDFARLAATARPDRDATLPPAGPPLAAPSPANSPTLLTTDTSPRGAPQYLTAFVGRAEELARLQAWLVGPQRTITVLGAPGCGKTRLAAELFNRQRALHPQARQAFVELDRLPPGPLASAAPGHAELVAHIAQALGLVLAGDTPSPERLADFLAGQPTLLLLDNFEHRLGDQPLLARLQRVPGLRMVITSRVRLALDADAVLLLDGLPLQAPDAAAPPTAPAGTAGAAADGTCDALRLFEARCRAVQGSERADALHLCRLLQGQPLAIELAARTCRALPPAELARRLAADLDSLATHALDLPPRQRSLRAAFDTHWQLLAEPLRDALRRLSVLRADFSAGSARGVARLGEADIAALIDHSLLRATPDGARLRWHPFVREFSFEHLQADPVLARQMRQAHVAHFSAQLQRLGADETRPSRAALHYLATEAENLAEAWRHALALEDRPAQRQLAEALTLHHEFQARCMEGAALLEDADDPVVALLRARLLHWAAPHRAQAIADDAEARLRDSGDVAGQIAAARVRGLIAWRRGAPALAVQQFRTGLALGRQHGLPALRAILLDGLGLALADQGDAAGARAAFGEALALNDAVGNDLQAVQNLINLSLDARLTAPARAQALAQRALSLCHDIGFAHYEPHAQIALSLALSAGGSATAARQAVDTALAATRRSGDDYAECWAGVALAQACRAAGDLQGARAATHRGLAQAWRLGDASLMTQHLAEAGCPDDGQPLAQRVHEALGRLV